LEIPPVGSNFVRIDFYSMSKVSPQINSISLKAEALNQMIVKAKEERSTLEQMIGDLSEKLEKKQEEIEVLQEENGKLKMANSLTGSGNGGKEVKLKINELVREIDKCIALLNG